VPIVAVPAVGGALLALALVVGYLLLREAFRGIAAGMPALLGVVRDAFNAVADWLSARIEAVVGPVADLGQNIAGHIDNARAVVEGVGFRLWTFAWSVPNVLIPRAVGAATAWAAGEINRALAWTNTVAGSLNTRIDQVIDWADARIASGINDALAWTNTVAGAINDRIDRVMEWADARIAAGQKTVVDWIGQTVVPDILRWVSGHVASLTGSIAATRAIAEAAQATAEATERCLPRCGSTLRDLLQDLDDDGMDSLGYLAAAVLGLLAVPHLDEAIARLEAKMPELVAGASRILRT
jgi:phage-related protein